MFNAFEKAQFTSRPWFGAWFRERIVTGWWWLIPMGVSIALVSGTQDWFFRAIVAMIALAFFRLFDDLTDVAHDRRIHPKRKLSQLDSLVRPSICCALGLLLTGILINIFGTHDIYYLGAIVIIAMASYLRNGCPPMLRIVYAQLILLKFPALAIALASTAQISSKSLSHAACLYGFVGGYEILHDAEARQSKWATAVFGGNLMCFAWGLVFSFGGRGE